jgi:hypothetical protein
MLRSLAAVLGISPQKAPASSTGAFVVCCVDGPGSWLRVFSLVVPYRVASTLAAVLASHVAALTPLVALYFSQSLNAGLVQPSPELLGAGPIGLPP